MRETYTFGDTTAAARRLGLVAAIFDPSSRELLRQAGGGRDRPDLAVDLGCGPGHTTRLLVETLRPRRAVGLDRADTFLDLARANVPDPAGFAAHDVTRAPFPVGPADLLYCRFLLSHLTGHERLLATWATQLRPGGLLVLDEVDWIRTEDPALAAYLDAVTAVMGRQGHVLEVGQALDALPDPAGLHRHASDVRVLTPPADQAARMFGLNLTVWGAGEAAQALVGQAELDRIAAELDALGRGDRAAGITWGMRGIVYERRPT